MIRFGPHRRAALLSVVAALLLSMQPVSMGAKTALAQPAQDAPAAPALAAPSVKDPAAMALLKRMCDRLQAARTFTARGRLSLELPVTGGYLATFYNDFDLSLRRPDGLNAHRLGDMQEFRFVFDGKSMTVHVPGMGKWGTTSAPSTIDAMLPVAGEQAGLNMPFDELIVADPYAAVTAGVTDAVMAGQAVIDGKKVEHLVLSGPQLRVEYWIDPATALPARSLVVYVDHTLQPHFGVQFAEWKLDAKLPDATFALPKPKGATEVTFGEAAGAFR
jgi:hypothetical protein